MSDERTGRASGWLVCAALIASVLAVYARAGGFAFVRYDDPDYVLDNPIVRRGLTWDGLRWAFTSLHASNWHPLTWLSHMLDVELHDLRPGGHHLTSVGLHALSSAVAFLTLRALLRPRGERLASWAAAGTAFLFALHPLRVESVAWISERKDVLAGLFFFLTLSSWARYAAAPSRARYALALGLYALGLLAKPMLVSVPFVLLALDLWPLERRTPRARLLLEKVPFLLLAAASAGVTLVAQRAGGSVTPLETLSLAERLANAPLAILRYLAHFVWPSGLAYFYPHRGLVGDGAAPWNAAAWSALTTVLALSVGALACARRAPVVLLGWAWFLVMLLPVLGLVQVGEQALADRYAYLPLVGPQLALAWGLARLAERRARWRAPLVLGSGGILVALGLASARQAEVWRDPESLTRHALAVTEKNYAAWAGLANELATRGDLAGAREAYESALAIHPRFAPALYSYALLEQQQGNGAHALELYRAAVEALPGYAPARLNLGALLAANGDTVAAAQEFEAVLALFPDHPDAHFDLALLFLMHGGLQPALPHLEAAVRARPDFSAAWEKLGQVREELGQHREALEALERAARDPARLDAARLAAWILATASEPRWLDAPRALALARHAVAGTNGADPRALEVLAAAQAASGAFEAARATQEEALKRLAPGQQAEARERLERYRRGEPFRHAH